MNFVLLKALAGSVPTCMMFLGALIWFLRGKTVYSFLQLLGVTSLVVVVFAHVSEGLGLFPRMGWGLEHSAGHYLDLSGAILGLVLFPTGYLLHSLAKRRA
jgi:hypothetical protein